MKSLFTDIQKRDRQTRLPYRVKRELSSSSGYSLLETLMAVSVLTIGLVSLLGFLTQSMANMHVSQEELIAKLKSREALETIYSALNTQQVTFDMIQNDTVSGGIFLDGFQPLLRPNPTSGSGDGLVGTADDGAVETLQLPGPDGQLGNGDDVVRALTNFDRQIKISPVLDAQSLAYDDLRQISVTVRYTTPTGWERSYQVASYVSRYR